MRTSTGLECTPDKNVGAGLLANAVDQSQACWLTDRIREPARSHI